MSRIANDPETIADMSNDGELADVIHNRLYPKLVDYKYSYNFSWLGIPIIQVPQDILALQEIIWGVKPDLIVETGIAHGGSLVFYASMLEIIGKGGVVGIDIDIRAHNRKAIENSPLFHRITLIEGSSIDKAVVEKVYTHAENCPNVMVILDSDHTYDH
ncbi:MAG: CmcI family methyltransferase, partial [Thermodesulfobacteriota bacterium]|nr:CmcI family methyltransferase [Thermodesulfobacteriota bacterium]